MTDNIDTNNPSDGLSYGTFPITILSDGSVVVYDLAELILPVLRKLLQDDSILRKQLCVVHKPKLVTAKKVLTMQIETIKRLMISCEICERRCGVNRLNGERGFCELGETLRVGAYANLYNEGCGMGSPAFSVFAAGCSMRCDYCYRNEFLQTEQFEVMQPETLAVLLDKAAENGSTCWHFLGGNPDQSILPILTALSLTKQTLPVVWNTAFTMTPQTIQVLREVVDIWVPDIKFGNNNCAKKIAKFDNYWNIVKRNIKLIQNEKQVYVRIPKLPKHETCCQKLIKEFLKSCSLQFVENEVVTIGKASQHKR
ncbi:MAG: radical SAM protein [Planctomycetaceae bacterium]|jgi:putative pyruvate formate lyase activating enzyme|nr:radical SAM protein [Planctomycetaceae bacterium]